MRVSATQLESFRLFLEPEQEWFTEQMLLESLIGTFVPTPAVKLGHAYHAVLEQPEAYRVSGGYVCEGFSFDDATLDPLLEVIDRRGVFEVKTTKTIGDVTLVAHADHLCGRHLSEFKTTKQFDIDKYLGSAQWRVYALLFDALAITYRVATVDDHGNGVVTLKDVNSLTLYPYPALRSDVLALLDRFVAYVESKGLAPLLRDRQQAAEAA